MTGKNGMAGSEEDLAQVREWFKAHRDERYKFDRIKHPKSKRPAMHALILIDALEPGIDSFFDAVSGCGSYLSCLDGEFSPQALKKMTEAHVVELLRCGVDFGRRCWNVTV